MCNFSFIYLFSKGKIVLSVCMFGCLRTIVAARQEMPCWAGTPTQSSERALSALD